MSSSALYDELVQRGAVPMGELASLEGFWEGFGAPNVPCIVRGLAEAWPARRGRPDGPTAGWSLSRMAETMGDAVSHVTADGDSFQMMSVRDFVAQIDSESLLYMKDATFHLDTPLMQDFATPEPFRNLLCSPELTDKHPRLNSPNYPAWSWLYLGPKGSMSPLHVDIFESSAWNCVLEGRKLWLFYGPEHSAASLQDGNGEFVNPFLVANWKLDQLKHGKPHIVIQNPGDVVFTPSSWYHAVYNLEPGIALTENFVNHSNVGRVRTAVKRELASLEDAELIEATSRVLAELERILGD